MATRIVVLLLEEAGAAAHSGLQDRPRRRAKRSSVEAPASQPTQANPEACDSWTLPLGPSALGPAVGTLVERLVGQAAPEPLPEAGSRTVIVLMPFSPDLNDVYNLGVRPCVEAVGLTCVRADELEHSGSIIGEIVGQIRRCQIAIAEVSDQNASVYYEVGWAHALRRPTVLLARKGAQLPLMIGHINTMFYSDVSELRSRLPKRLRAITGVPAAKRSHTQCGVADRHGREG